MCFKRLQLSLSRSRNVCVLLSDVILRCHRLRLPVVSMASFPRYCLSDSRWLLLSPLARYVVPCAVGDITKRSKHSSPPPCCRRPVISGQLWGNKNKDVINESNIASSNPTSSSVHRKQKLLERVEYSKFSMEHTVCLRNIYNNKGHSFAFQRRNTRRKALFNREERLDSPLSRNKAHVSEGTITISSAINVVNSK